MKPEPNRSNPRWHCFKGLTFLPSSVLMLKQADVYPHAKGICESQGARVAERCRLAGRQGASRGSVIAYRPACARLLSAPGGSPVNLDQTCPCCSEQSNCLTNAAQCIFTVSFISFRMQTHINRALFPHTSLQIIARKPSYKIPVSLDLLRNNSTKECEYLLLRYSLNRLLKILTSSHQRAIKMKQTKPGLKKKKKTGLKLLEQHLGLVWPACFCRLQIPLGNSLLLSLKFPPIHQV